MKTWRIIAATLLAICAAQAARGDAMPSLAVVALDRIADGAFVTEAQVERACKALMAGLPEVAERYAPGTERLAKLLSARDEIAILALRMTARQDTDAAWETLVSVAKDEREALEFEAIACLATLPDHAEATRAHIAGVLDLGWPSERTRAQIDALARLSAGAAPEVWQATQAKYASTRAAACDSVLRWGASSQVERVIRHAVWRSCVAKDEREIIRTVIEAAAADTPPGARAMLINAIVEPPGIEFMSNFAAVARVIASVPAALVDILDAIVARDAKAVSAERRGFRPNAEARALLTIASQFGVDGLALAMAESSRRHETAPDKPFPFLWFLRLDIPLSSVPIEEVLRTGEIVAAAASDELALQVAEILAAKRVYSEKGVGPALAATLARRGLTVAECESIARVLKSGNERRTRDADTLASLVPYEYIVDAASEKDWWAGGVRRWIADTAKENGCWELVGAESRRVRERAIELLTSELATVMPEQVEPLARYPAQARDGIRPRSLTVRAVLLVLEGRRAANAADAFVKRAAAELREYARVGADDGKTIKLYELVMGEAPKLVGDK